MKTPVLNVITVIVVGMLCAVSTVFVNAQDGIGEGTVISSIAWSPDGSKIAVARFSKIEILDATNQTLLQTLIGEGQGLREVDWTSDSTKLVCASLDGVDVWDIATGQIIATKVVQSIAAKWHPDNVRVASAVTSINIGIWNTSTGQDALLVLPGSSFDWNPDGSQLVSAIYDKAPITVTDIAIGQTLLMLPGHTNGVGDVAWSPDGTKIASGGVDNTVRVWDATTGAVLIALSGHTDIVTTVGWNSNNTVLASGSSDGTVRFWDTQTGQALDIVQAGGQVRSIAWSPDGSQLAYGGEDGVLAIVPAPAALLATAAPTASAQETAPIRTIDWHPDNSQIAVGIGNTVQIINSVTGNMSQYLTGSNTEIKAVDWSPDGQLIAAASLDGGRYWNVSTEHMVVVHDTALVSLKWNPVITDMAISIVGEGVDIWNSETNTISNLVPIAGTSIDWNPKGSHLVMGNNSQN